MESARTFCAVILASVGAMLAACGAGAGADDGTRRDFCDSLPFTPAARSEYVLPYTVGTTFTMFQGNCPVNPAWGHHDMFAYDFDLPLGTPVLAMRAGLVIFTIDQFSDDDHVPGHENLVVVRHADGTLIRYAHLTLNGVIAVQGAPVLQGALLGFSGNSGNSSGPHLHIDLLHDNSCYCKANTMPLTFRNAGGRAESSGELIQDEAYTALPFS